MEALHGRHQQSSHTQWERKYHVVWIPQYRRKKLFEGVRKELGPVLRELAQHKESEILEGRMLLDHVHMLIAILPKHAVSQVVGCMKGKSAIHITRAYLGRERKFAGHHFWARGSYISTVCLDEAGLRQYIQKQEEEDRHSDQRSLFGSKAAAGGSQQPL